MAKMGPCFGRVPNTPFEGMYDTIWTIFWSPSDPGGSKTTHFRMHGQRRGDAYDPLIENGI